MTNKPEHTPREAKLKYFQNHEDTFPFTICTDDELCLPVALTEFEEAAATIVDRCNNYHRLVEENKALREQNQWISTDVEWPKIGERVLVLVEGLVFTADILQSGFGILGSGFPVGSKVNVTHWRYFAAPNEEVEK